MAGLGMTLVDGINEVVEVIGDFPMSGTAPTASGTSVYSRAHRFIDRETTRILSEGWPENTVLAQTFPLDTEALDLVNETPPVLRVRGAGPDRHRHLVLRGTAVYDADQKSLKLTTREGNTDRTEVMLDVVVAADFEDVSPQLQDVIIAKAKLAFQRRLQGNPSVDQALQQELWLTQQALDRNEPNLDQAWNIQPEFRTVGRSSTNPQMQASQGEQQRQ